LGPGVTPTAPEPLSERHRTGAFTCGNIALDEWLKRRALANRASGASRTFVANDVDRIIGYYALAAGAVSIAAAPGRFRRNMPDPIPVAVLARLAVDRVYQGGGIGRALFRDSAMRIAHAADAIGIRGVLVHAISDEARAFYLAIGFDPWPLEPMTLMVTLADVRKSFE
jgi:GNAT superfamily N-acetyltransferase